MKYLHCWITLNVIAAAAHAGLSYELMPSVYHAQPGDTIQTFATLTNTGPEVLYYAYSFVDPGTIPVTAVTGQLPPLVLDPAMSSRLLREQSPAILRRRPESTHSLRVWGIILRPASQTSLKQAMLEHW